MATVATTSNRRRARSVFRGNQYMYITESLTEFVEQKRKAPQPTTGNYKSPAKISEMLLSPTECGTMGLLRDIAAQVADATGPWLEEEKFERCYEFCASVIKCILDTLFELNNLDHTTESMKCILELKSALDKSQHKQNLSYRDKAYLLLFQFDKITAIHKAQMNKALEMVKLGDKYLKLQQWSEAEHAYKEGTYILYEIATKNPEEVKQCRLLPLGVAHTLFGQKRYRECSRYVRLAMRYYPELPTIKSFSPKDLLYKKNPVEFDDILRELETQCFIVAGKEDSRNNNTNNSNSNNSSNSTTTMSTNSFGRSLDDTSSIITATTTDTSSYLKNRYSLPSSSLSLSSSGSAASMGQSLQFELQELQFLLAFEYHFLGNISDASDLFKRLDHPEIKEYAQLFLETYDGEDTETDDEGNNSHSGDGTNAASKNGGTMRLSEAMVREMVMAMKDPNTGLIIRDRKHRFRRYEQCFVGSEAVTWLVENGSMQNRRQAVDFCQKLLDLHIIAPVVNSKEQQFHDDHSFYNFRESAEDRLVPIKEGYLMKRGQVKWNRRYFVLYNTILCYYDNPKDRTPRNTLYLRLSKKNEVTLTMLPASDPSSSKRPYTFRIEDKNQAVLISADTEEEMHSWIDAITKRIFYEY